MGRRVTLTDVSREAKVGVATVSRALAVEPHPDVSEQTRDRIRKIADRLGYHPSLAARALRRGQYQTISVIVPDDAWGWWEPVVHSAFVAADERGYTISVHPIANRSGGAAAVVESLGGMPTDGALLFGPADDPAVLRTAHRLGLPIVAIDDASTSVVLPTVSVDNVAGARTAVEHLLATGRRHIVYLGSGLDSAFAHDRREGYVQALRAAGNRDDIVVSCADCLDESTLQFSEFDALLADRPGIDAVFCEFDLMAAPVYRSLRASRRSVPTDVAVMGFDDERAAQLLDPPLSTMRQPYSDMGALALGLLIERLEGRDLPAQRTLLSASFVRRQST